MAEEAQVFSDEALADDIITQAKRAEGHAAQEERRRARGRDPLKPTPSETWVTDVGVA